jgi:hypothetical protein
MGRKMKPQSAQRKTLCPRQEFPFKDKAEQVISCATEVHKSGVKGFGITIYKIYEAAQVVPNLRLVDKRVGLLINFNTEKQKGWQKRAIM